MARKETITQAFELVHPICCGIDVHKKILYACILKPSKNGKIKAIIQKFGTFTKDLYQLRNWLIEHDCPVVALESTSDYWKPVHNVLENEFEVILANARHLKHLPGRKTDIEDCKWIASCLRYGLIKPSFIPDQEVREWRSITRLQKQYVNDLGATKQRIQKLFESANIKISSVLSDPFGVSGRNLMHLLITKETISKEDVIQNTKVSADKKARLYDAIQGFFLDSHRDLLKMLLETLQHQESQIEKLEARVKELTAPYRELLERLKKVPGIQDRAAMGIISELGIDLGEFPVASALCSWTGVCPSNNESAGKRKKGKKRVPSGHLKTLLVEVAWAAIKKKGTFYREKYYRLKPRLGAQKAIMAIAHRILKAIFNIIKHGQSYKELGADYVDKRSKKARLKRLYAQAKSMGYKLVPVTN